MTRALQSIPFKNLGGYPDHERAPRDKDPCVLYKKIIKFWSTVVDKNIFKKKKCHHNSFKVLRTIFLVKRFYSIPFPNLVTLAKA